VHVLSSSRGELPGSARATRRTATKAGTRSWIASEAPVAQARRAVQ